MENKSLKLGVDKLPFPQYLDEIKNDYDTVKGKDGATYVHIKNTGIVLPMIVSSAKRVLLFTETNNIGANSSYTSPVYDFTNLKSIQGLVSSNVSGTLYIQESDDKILWTTVQAIKFDPAQLTELDVGAKGKTFKADVYTKFVRLLYSNGTTSQTSFLLSVYTVL